VMTADEMRVAALVALRDRLAREVSECSSRAEHAALSAHLAAVRAQIDSASAAGEVPDDELSAQLVAAADEIRDSQ
jgi:hypothetical protein